MTLLSSLVVILIWDKELDNSWEAKQTGNGLWLLEASY